MMRALRRCVEARHAEAQSARRMVFKSEQCRRNGTAATNLAEEVSNELEQQSIMTPLPEDETIKHFDPIANSRARKRQLPSSRYNFRPPKYYRGPLHPHQPPSPSDPSSRDFIPGPFMLTRMEQTYESTIAPDLMTLLYSHRPPGFVPHEKGPRLRPWVGDSPYFKNRPLRGPRGGDVLRLLKRRTTFRNIPKIEGVTVHSMIGSAGSGALRVAGMVVQAITNVRVTTFRAKESVAQWEHKAGRFCAVTAHLKGEDMYHFLSKCIDMVLPRIKDWRGVKGSSGDSSGNITFGLPSEAVRTFPEIEVNYDMYPPKLVPGCHVTVHTSATRDKEARVLLTALGIPFYGKFID